MDVKEAQMNRANDNNGTGKNTEWLITKAKYITAIDLSE
jgi:hypothetical protein